MGLGLAITTGLKTLFGVIKVADNSQSIQKAIDNIDQLSLTAEERADHLLELRKLDQSLNSEQTKTRREVALLWIRYQISLTTVYLISVALGLRYSFIKNLSDKLWEVQELYWYGTLAVLTYFFGAHLIRQAKK